MSDLFPQITPKPVFFAMIQGEMHTVSVLVNAHVKTMYRGDTPTAYEFGAGRDDDALVIFAPRIKYGDFDPRSEGGAKLKAQAQELGLVSSIIAGQLPERDTWTRATFLQLIDRVQKELREQGHLAADMPRNFIDIGPVPHKSFIGSWFEVFTANTNAWEAAHQHCERAEEEVAEFERFFASLQERFAKVGITDGVRFPERRWDRYHISGWKNHFIGDIRKPWIEVNGTTITNEQLIHLIGLLEQERADEQAAVAFITQERIKQ